MNTRKLGGVLVAAGIVLGAAGHAADIIQELSLDRSEHLGWECYLETPGACLESGQADRAVEAWTDRGIDIWLAAAFLLVSGAFLLAEGSKRHARQDPHLEMWRGY